MNTFGRRAYRGFGEFRAGNLSGNTFDYLLHRISLGRWGG
jgi:hypothetical protein